MAELSPELASKALHADVRNTLTDVAQGGTLPASKRSLFEEVVTSQAEPAAIIERRRAALLHRWASGGKLNKDELAEIADVLPDPTAIERRVTRERYQHRLEHYASAYGYAVRNVKKWLAIGRTHTPPDLPPLDDAAQMPAWWSRNMKQRCPGRLLAAKGASAQTAAAAQPDSKSTTTAPVAAIVRPPAPASPVDGDSLMATGYAAMIARATHAELVAWQAWQASLQADPFDPGDEEMRRRAYDRACEQARKVLKDRDAGLAGDDEWGRWSEFEQACQEHLSVLNQSLRSSPVRVATKLALPAEMFQRLADVWNAELDRVFAFLDRVSYRKAATAEDTEGEDFQLAAQ